MDRDTCLVCAEDFDNYRLRCVVPCGHDNTCSICFLRIRALNREKTCPTCKRDLEHVIATSHETGSTKSPSKTAGNLETWADFEIWGDNCNSNHVLDERSGMFFPKEYIRQTVDKFWAFKCTKKGCGAVKRDIKALKAHYTAEHQLQMCGLCIEHKQVFPSEQKTYTQGQYETHLRKGDNDGSEGHPRCDFCAVRFYDKTALFTHLHKDHYTCHLCEKYANVSYKYYKDYRDLESHFHKDHFLCDERECLQRKFVVFWGEEEYDNHCKAWHPFKELRGGSSGRKGGKMNVTFGLKDDAMGAKQKGKAKTAYDGGVAGRASNGEWAVEVEGRSVDPRAAEREGQLGGLVADSSLEQLDAFQSRPFELNTAVAEYPSLGPASSGGSGSVLGWQGSHGGSQRSGDLSNQAFPSLEGAGVAKAHQGDVSRVNLTSYGAARRAGGERGEATFGGIKIKEDKKAKKKQEAYEARKKEEAERAQAKAEAQARAPGFSEATSGQSLAVKLATGKVKADFSNEHGTSSSGNNGGVKTGAPSAAPAPWERKAAPARSLGSKGHVIPKSTRPGAGGGWGMQPVAHKAKPSSSSGQWSSVGAAKGPALAPGLGGVSPFMEGAGEADREGEKVAPSLSFGLGSMIKTDKRDAKGMRGGGGSNGSSRSASSNNLASYVEHQHDEEKEMSSAVRAIERMQAGERERERDKEDVWLDKRGVPAPEEAVPPPLVPEAANPVPPPPGLGVPPGLGPPAPPGSAQPKGKGGFAAAVASNPSNGSGKGKGEKKPKGQTKPAGISKKKKKELQSLLYG